MEEDWKVERRKFANWLQDTRNYMVVTSFEFFGVCMCVCVVFCFFFPYIRKDGPNWVTNSLTSL